MSEFITKKVEDLKVGDRIKIISTALLEQKLGITDRAEIIEIIEHSFGGISYILHFEGNHKRESYPIDLSQYQMEFQVMPPRRGRVGTLSCDVSALPYREEDLKAGEE
jgi:hypothetical protein